MRCPLVVQIFHSVLTTLVHDHPAEKRQAEASRIRDKYPDRIPVRGKQWLACGVGFGAKFENFDMCYLSAQVIVEKAEKSDIPDIDKKKCEGRG